VIDVINENKINSKEENKTINQFVFRYFSIIVRDATILRAKSTKDLTSLSFGA